MKGLLNASWGTQGMDFKQLEVKVALRLAPDIKTMLATKVSATLQHYCRALLQNTVDARADCIKKQNKGSFWESPYREIQEYHHKGLDNV